MVAHDDDWSDDVKLMVHELDDASSLAPSPD